MSTVVDYTSRDFDSLRASLLQYAQVNFPDWIPGSEGDFGVLLLELLAYVGDVNSYYIDRAQNEAYLPTASQMSSVLAQAQLLGYVPGTGAPATGTVVFVASSLTATTATPAITVPAGTQLATDYIAAIDGQIIFETDIEVVVTPGQATAPVAVTEGQTQKDPTTGNPIQIDTSTGMPDQTYQIPKPRVYVDTVQVYVAGTEWRNVDHLLDADENDQVFETFNDANGYTWIRFGDNVNGAIPGVGLDIGVIYRTGYGSQGNVTAGKVTTVYDKVSGISIQKSSATSGLTTSSAMTGGADPESIDSIRNNAPKTFFTQQRAVRLDDFTNFALGVAGVSKANAIADYFSSVTVYVIGPDGGAPSQTLRDNVALVLQDNVLAGVSVSVGSPTAVLVNIGATGGSEVAIQVWPTYSRPDVQYQVEQAIKGLLTFTNVDLGMKLTVSDVYKAVMAVDGVRYAAIPLMARADSAQTGTADIQFQAWEYPQAGNVVVTSTGGIG